MSDIRSKPSNKAYRDGWDRMFKRAEPEKPLDPILCATYGKPGMSYQSGDFVLQYATCEECFRSNGGNLCK
jgi:hypothetical protein